MDDCGLIRDLWMNFLKNHDIRRKHNSSFDVFHIYIILYTFFSGKHRTNRIILVSPKPPIRNPYPLRPPSSSEAGIIQPRVPKAASGSGFYPISLQARTLISQDIHLWNGPAVSPLSASGCPGPDIIAVTCTRMYAFLLNRYDTITIL